MSKVGQLAQPVGRADREDGGAWMVVVVDEPLRSQ
jgi:hypothetical protein